MNNPRTRSFNFWAESSDGSKPVHVRRYRKNAKSQTASSPYLKHPLSKGVSTDFMRSAQTYNCSLPATMITPIGTGPNISYRSPTETGDNASSPTLRRARLEKGVHNPRVLSTDVANGVAVDSLLIYPQHHVAPDSEVLLTIDVHPRNVSQRGFVYLQVCLC